MTDLINPQSYCFDLYCFLVHITKTFVHGCAYNYMHVYMQMGHGNQEVDCIIIIENYSPLPW